MNKIAIAIVAKAQIATTLKNGSVYTEEQRVLYNGISFEAFIKAKIETNVFETRNEAKSNVFNHKKK